MSLSHTSADEHSAARWIARVVVLLVALFVLRAVLAAVLPLTGAEAYQWLLGLRWEPASFNGPGGIAWLAITLDPPGTGGSWIFARLVAPLSSILATAGVWWFARLLAPGRGHPAPWLAAAAWNLLPGINTAALSLDPRLPFTAAWIWFAAFCIRALQTSKHRSEGGFSASTWWLLAALAAAIGARFSYTFWLAPCALVLFACVRPAQCLRSPGFLLSFPLLALACVDLWLWNRETGWIAFAGTTTARWMSFGGPQSLDALVALLRGAGVAAVPWIFGASAWCAFRFRRSPSARLMLPLLLPATFAAVMELWNGQQSTLPLWMPLAAVAIPWAASGLFREAASIAKMRRFAALALLLTALQAALAAAGVAMIHREPPWSDLAARLRRAALIHQAAGEAPLFLVAAGAQPASALAHPLLQAGDRDALGTGFPPVFVIESQFLSDQFALWPRYDEFVAAPPPAPGEYFTEQHGVNPYIGRSALYLSTEAPDALPQTLRGGFSRVIPLEEISTHAGVWYLYLCEDYQSAPL